MSGFLTLGLDSGDLVMETQPGVLSLLSGVHSRCILPLAIAASFAVLPHSLNFRLNLSL